MKIIGIYRIYTMRSRRGTVLITAMWIVIALTAVVLVLCREMVVESMTTRQHLSQARADAAEIGMEQFVLSVVEQEIITPGYKDSETWEQRQIGDTYCWVMTYNINDPEETSFAYGLTDEASKVDLNSATVDMLEFLPGMTYYPNLGAEIVDWRDPDDLVTISALGGQGEESNDYMATYGYGAKNSNFESAEELRLLDGVDDVFLYGGDHNHNNVLDAAEANSADASSAFDISKLGVMPFVTVYGVRATNPDTTSTSTVTTPIAALNLTDSAGNQIVAPLDINSAIQQNTTQSQMITTVLNLELPAKATAVANAIRTRLAVAGTTTTSQFTSLFDLAIAAQLTTQDLTAIYPYFITMPRAAAAGATASTSSWMAVGKININTASKPAMMCLPGLEEEDVDSLISYRETVTLPTDANGNSQISNVAWLMDVITDQTKLKEAGAYITGQSTIFSADIVTVSQDGRAFKRVKIVVDASTGTPLIIYRKDMTDAGWPLDPSIREALRKGDPLPPPGSTNGTAAGNGLSLGVP